MPILRQLLGSLLLRSVLVAVGTTSLVWAISVLVVWPQPTGLERLGARILRGERYAATDLNSVARAIETTDTSSSARATSLTAAATVTLRQFELAIAEARRADIDAHTAALGPRVMRALEVAPSSSFLWLAKYWADVTSNGFSPQRSTLLGMSYSTGPNEGWIAVRRNPLALAIYPRLSPALQERVIEEFVGLVESGFPEMPAILAGAGWATRDALVSRLAAVSEPRRKAFARALYQAGLDLDIPGIDRPSTRPWSR